MKQLHLLQQLAQQHGIQTSYFDVSGGKRDAAPETLIALLKALGVSASNDAEVVAALRDEADSNQGVDPVLVAWEGKAVKINLQAQTGVMRRNVYCHLRLENGEEQNWCVRLDQLRGTRLVKRADRTVLNTTIALPRLPLGYHEFSVEGAGELSRSLIISAPTRSYTSPHLKRACGLFLPMYAAHSENSWGAGNFSDWERLAAWVSSAGGKVIGSLPILAAFLDNKKCEPSPYSPASRLFWNEFYIDVTRIPEFSTCAPAQKLVGANSFQNQLRKFREESEVDYRAQMLLRRQVLEVLAECLFAKPSTRRAQFEKFLRERPQLRDYAAFRATCEKQKSSWHQWSERMRNGKLIAGDYSEKEMRYHLYVQWIAHEQMSGLLERCRENNVSFYLDLPLGVNPDGYDVWRERDAFVQGVNAGAPPDTFFTKGQDWGFAPLHPERLRKQNYRYFIEMLRFQMRHTGLLRIDHIMGLRRLYWIPQGRPASEGAYVTYQDNELYAILALESHRHKTVIVGENLGTVPPEVNAAMDRHHLRQMYVVQYDLRPEAKKALGAPPLCAVASLNTHDMPTFAAFWEGADIVDRYKLGLIPRSKLQHERRARQKLTSALAKYLKKQRLLKTDRPNAEAAMTACLKYLAKRDSELLLVNLEDLWLEKAPQNVPGTCEECPNWRRKARFSMEEIEANDQLRELLSQLTALRKK